MKNENMANMANATDGSSPGLLNTIELSFNDCKLCGVNVKNPCVCKKCKSVFHPSCFNRAVQAKNQTCAHEKDVALSFSTNASDNF
jgi:hypothetical protein